MYVGDTTARGLHHCVYKLIDYANDRDASRICVSLNADGSVTVTDDGRGRDRKSLEQSMTDLKFDQDITRTDGGLHGLGPVVVNFLAAKCDVESSTAGETFRQSYRRGVATTPVDAIGQAKKDGMKIVVLPDESIFKTTQLRYPIIKERIQELSFLRVGVRYSLAGGRTGESEEFHSDHGAHDFVSLLNRKTKTNHPVIALKGKTGGIRYDIAFQYSPTFKEQMQSYGNNVQSHKGGLHVRGFKRSFVGQLRQAGVKHGIPLDSIEDTDTFFDGLTSVIAVRLEQAQWEGSTRTVLANEELFGVIEAAMDDFLPAYFENNPTTAVAILRKILQSAAMRTMLPPIDEDLFSKQQRRLTKPEEDPNGWGATAWFPNSYRRRMTQRNGGEIRTQTDSWTLFPIRDESSDENLKRTTPGVVEQTLRAYSMPGIPNDALAVASNSHGDLLVFIRRTDRPPGGDGYPFNYADEVYRWDHESHELTRIASDFGEICWGPDAQTIG
jgi:DNA gyrase subunit B